MSIRSVDPECLAGCLYRRAPISSDLSVSEDQDELPGPLADEAADGAPAEEAPASEGEAIAESKPEPA